MGYVVGIDGGGSRTTAVLVTLDGRICAHASGGSSNFQVVGEEAVVRTIAATLAALPAQLREIDALALGLAGLHTAADRAHFTTLIGALAPESRLTVWTDADVALSAATGGDAGMIVIGGTGSIAIGRDAHGRIERCGGWGYLIGDEGSAYAIARAALQAASRGLDGRAPVTSLATALSLALGVPHFDDLLRPLYGPPPMTRYQIAQLAPVVTRCAQEGDARARALLAMAGEELAALAIALGVRLDFGTDIFPVACIGGVWHSGDFVSLSFRERVHAAFPSATIGPPATSPAAGAALLAMCDLLGNEQRAALWHTLCLSEENGA